MSLVVQKTVVVTPVLDTSIYASGDQVGALTEIPNVLEGPSGTSNLLSLSIVDKNKQAAILQILLFKDKPVVTSVDNAALDISSTEMASKCLGVISVVAGDYFALNANSVATLKNIQMIVSGSKSTDNSTGKSLWMIMRSGGTPTYTASGLVLTLGVRRG